MLVQAMVVLFLGSALGQDEGYCKGQVSSLVRCMSEAGEGQEAGERKAEKREALAQCFSRPGCQNPAEAKEDFKACAQQQLGGLGDQFRSCAQDQGLSLPQQFVRNMLKMATKALGKGGKGRRGGRKSRGFGGRRGGRGQARPSREDREARRAQRQGEREERRNERVQSKVDRFCPSASLEDKSLVAECLVQFKEQRRGQRQERRQSRFGQGEEEEGRSGRRGRRGGRRGGRGGRQGGQGGMKAAVKSCFRSFDMRSCRAELAEQKEILCQCGSQMKEDREQMAGVEAGLKQCAVEYLGMSSEEVEEKAQGFKQALGQMAGKVCGRSQSPFRRSRGSRRNWN